ncbi:TIGR01244 family sulfur transferase [Alcaligenes phenolicus]|uniref:TIGR01244 family sulfur transferase n=1 Tax=Alcaligenes phenolicus TaxID=232846 RepID=A0AAW5VIQ2_9BURK|nr:TIGR01244 family sulfur transferase [Alcaligenes phenolicus]MCX5564044.1 TIGR01244 family sulfur transferase [Alcaligenes phenolicus]
MSFPHQFLTEQLAVAPQLSGEDMQTVADAGFKSVIINRPDMEGGPDQPLSADVMKAAQAAGLQVEYQPVVGSAITSADVARFGQLLEALPGPTLAYCRTGTRCAVLFRALNES